MVKGQREITKHVKGFLIASQQADKKTEKIKRAGRKGERWQ
jgi:hypothetical protein